MVQNFLTAKNETIFQCGRWNVCPVIFSFNLVIMVLQRAELCFLQKIPKVIRAFLEDVNHVDSDCGFGKYFGKGEWC